MCRQFYAYAPCYKAMNFHNLFKHSTAPHKESGLAKKKYSNGIEIAKLQEADAACMFHSKIQDLP